MSIFRSAIKGENDEVDPGYLSMFWGLVGWSINNIIILGIAGYSARKTADAAALIQATGIALGANAGGFATMLGAVGLFRLGDKQQPSAPGTTTTVKEKETRTAGPAAAPAAQQAVEEDAALAAGRGVERLRPKIGPDDVNKSIALVGASKPKRGKRGK